MPAPPRPFDDWARVPARLAMVVTAFGGIAAMGWGLIAGLWTVGSGDYALLSFVVATAMILIATPCLSFQAASRGHNRLALAMTLPALLLYVAVLVSVMSASRPALTSDRCGARQSAQRPLIGDEPVTALDP